MISYHEARNKVIAILRGRQIGGLEGVVILDSMTIAKPYGWVFFYNSKKFVDTGDKIYSLVGGGPIVVISSTEEVHELGSTRPATIEITKLEERLGLMQ